MLDVSQLIPGEHELRIEGKRLGFDENGPQRDWNGLSPGEQHLCVV